MAYRFDPNFVPQQEYEFVPLQSPRGGLSNFAIGLGGSVINTAEGLVNAARYLGADAIPQPDWGKQYNEYFGMTGYDPKQFQFSDIVNTSSEWWQTGQGARDLGGLVGSIASLWVPGGLAAKGVGAIGKAAKVSEAMLGTAKALTAGAVAGTSESLVEFGGNRAEAEDLLAQGKSPLTQEEIEKRANENLGFNLGVTVGSDMALGALAFAVPGGKVLGKILKEGEGFKNIAKKAVAGGLTEYIQENVQTQSGNYVSGDWNRPLSPHDISAEGLQQTASVLLPWNQTPEEKLASSLGLISGGLFGGAGGIAQNIMNREQAPVITPTVPAVEVVTPSTTPQPVIAEPTTTVEPIAPIVQPTATESIQQSTEPVQETQDANAHTVQYTEVQRKLPVKKRKGQWAGQYFIEHSEDAIVDVGGKQATVSIWKNPETNEEFVLQPTADQNILMVDAKSKQVMHKVPISELGEAPNAASVYNHYMTSLDENNGVDAWHAEVLSKNILDKQNAKVAESLLQNAVNESGDTALINDIFDSIENDDINKTLSIIKSLAKQSNSEEAGNLWAELDANTKIKVPEYNRQEQVARPQQPAEVVALDEQQKIADQQKRKAIAEKGAIADVERTEQWQKQSKLTVSKIDIGEIEDSDKAKVNEKLSQPGSVTLDWGKDIRINQAKDGFVVVDNTKPRGSKSAVQKATSLTAAIEAAGKLRVEAGKKAYVNDDFYILKEKGKYKLGHEVAGLQDDIYSTYEDAVKDAQALKREIDKSNQATERKIQEEKRETKVEIKDKPASLSKDDVKNIITKSKTEPGLIKITDKLYASEGFVIQETRSGEWQVKNMGNLGNVQWGGGIYKDVQSAASIITKVVDRKVAKQPAEQAIPPRERLEKLVAKDIAQQKQKVGDDSESGLRKEIAQLTSDDGATRPERIRLQESATTGQRDALWSRINNKLSVTNRNEVSKIKNWDKIKENIIDTFSQLTEGELEVIFNSPNFAFEIINSDMVKEVGTKYGHLQKYVDALTNMLDFMGLYSKQQNVNGAPVKTIYINTDHVHSGKYYAPILLHETGHMIDASLDANTKDLFNGILRDIRSNMSAKTIMELRGLGYGTTEGANKKYSGITAQVIDDVLANEKQLLSMLNRQYDISPSNAINKREIVQLFHDIANINLEVARKEAFANMVMLSQPLRNKAFGLYNQLTSDKIKQVDVRQQYKTYKSVMGDMSRVIMGKYQNANRFNYLMKDINSINIDKLHPAIAHELINVAQQEFYNTHIKDFPVRVNKWEQALVKANSPSAFSVMNDIMKPFVDIGDMSATSIKEKLDAIINRPPLENATITGAHEKADMGITAYMLRVPSRVKDEVFQVIKRMADKALKVQERLRAEWKKESVNIWNKVKLNKEDYQKFIEGRIQADMMNRDIVETFKLDDNNFVNITWSDAAEKFNDATKAAAKQQEFAKIYKNTFVVQDGNDVYVVGYNNAKTFTNENDALRAAEADSYAVGKDFGLNETVVEAMLQSRKLYNKMFKAINTVRKATGLEEVAPLRGYLRHHFDNWIVTLRKAGVYEKGTEVVYIDEQGKTHKVSIVQSIPDGYTVESKSGRRDISASQITKVMKYPEGDKTTPHRFSAQTLGEAIDIARAERAKLGADYHIDIRNKFADAMDGIGEKSTEIQMDTSLTQEEKELFSNSVALTDKDFDTWLKLPENPYPTLANAVKAKSEWTNKELRAAINATGARKEIFRSGIYNFVSGKEVIQTEDLLTYLSHAGTRNRYLEALQERSGVDGFSKDLERVDSNYINQATRYIAMQPFKHNALLWYNKAYETDFYEKAPPTRAADYAHKYINDILGVPKALDRAIDQSIKDIPILGKLLQDKFGNRPLASMVGHANAFTTVTKLALFRVSSALLQTSIFMNINAKLDKQGISRYAGLGPKTREYIGIALGMGKYMNGKKYDNPKAAEYAEVLRYANLDLDFITMANEGGSSVFGGTESSQKNKYMSYAQKVINTSMKPFIYADMLGRRTAMLGFYDQALAKGMSKQQAMEYAEKNMFDTNFNQSISDSINAYRAAGSLGKLLFQFKQFPIKQMNFIYDLQGAEKKQFWTSYVMLAGAFGLPMVDWFKELFKGLFGVDLESEVKRHIINITGESEAGKFVRNQLFYGAFGSVPALVSESAGIDLHNRVGIPDMFPTKLRDLAGPTLSTGYNVIEHMFSDKDAETKLKGMLTSVSPVFKDYVDAVSGEIRSPYNRDRLVMELDAGQRLARILGFRPLEQSVLTDKEKMVMYFEDKRKEQNQSAIDKYLRSKDPDDLARLRELGVTTQQIRDEAKRKEQPAAERAIGMVPKKIKARYADIETM